MKQSQTSFQGIDGAEANYLVIRKNGKRSTEVHQHTRVEPSTVVCNYGIYHFELDGGALLMVVNPKASHRRVSMKNSKTDESMHKYLWPRPTTGICRLDCPMSILLCVVLLAPTCNWSEKRAVQKPILHGAKRHESSDEGMPNGHELRAYRTA